MSPWVSGAPGTAGAGLSWVVLLFSVWLTHAQPAGDMLTQMDPLKVALLHMSLFPLLG